MICWRFSYGKSGSAAVNVSLARDARLAVRGLALCYGVELLIVESRTRGLRELLEHCLYEVNVQTDC